MTTPPPIVPDDVPWLVKWFGRISTLFSVISMLLLFGALLICVAGCIHVWVA